MREARVIRWILKPVAWVACLGPAAWLVSGLVRGDLGADPVKTLRFCLEAGEDFVGMV